MNQQMEPQDNFNGSYCVRLTQTSFAGRPCLFLDRDGVVVEEVNYLHRPDDVVIINGVPNAIARVNRAGFPVVMVTNQAGIGRGLFSWEDFLAVQREILERCRRHDAHFDMVLACPHHPQGIGAYAAPDHPWRKPNPGMLLEAARTLQLDLAHSIIVGDTLTDLAAGEAAGLADGVLVLTGHGKRDQTVVTPATARQDGYRRRVAPTAAVAVANWLRARAPLCSENAP